MAVKIVFMGTPEFAVPCLQRLLTTGQEVAAVFTQPDKPKGRGYQLAAPPVKELALEYGLAVYQPAKLRQPEIYELLENLAPDLIVVVAYGKILPTEILKLPRLGCVNIHASLLPRYRGAGPIQWSVLNGERETGVTSMFMAEGLDTGDMILKLSTPIGENETSGELHDRLAELGAQCLQQTVELFEKGQVPRTPQEDREACYAPMLKRSMAQIDFAKPSKEVHNLIRGMHPWPVAYTRLGKKWLKIHRAVLAQGSGRPGEVLDEKTLTVACGEGAIRILELQLEGAKRMQTQDFLRGHPLQKGQQLTAAE